MDCRADHNDPLGIPAFLCRTCSKPGVAQTEPLAPAAAQEAHAPRPAVESEPWWPKGLRATHCTEEDIAAMRELLGQQELREAVKRAQAEARFVEFQAQAAANPELAKAKRAAKRAERRAERHMGVKATGKVYKGGATRKRRRKSAA